MNGYNFTERVRKSLQLAREEAAALRHEYVGTEHILIGFCRMDGGVATAALRNLSVEPEDVIRAVLETVTPGPTNGGASESSSLLGAIADTLGVGRRAVHDVPYTSRAKRVLELAMTEARECHHSYVGTEHLLLGLMREERGIGAQILAGKGLTIAAVRAEVLRLLGDEHASDGGMVRPATAEREAEITLVVEHPDGRIEARKFRRSGDAVKFLNGLEY